MPTEAASDRHSASWERAILSPIAQDFPTIDAAVAEIARLSAELTLQKGTIHVISDVHGEFAKFRHVINNASGTIRPLVDRLLEPRRTPEEIAEFLKLVFYPKETLGLLLLENPDAQDNHSLIKRILLDLFDVVRSLAKGRSLASAARVFPPDYDELFHELLHQPSSGRSTAYFDAMIDALIKHHRAFHLIRLTVRVLRNLAVQELILDGDCYDRGPRGDQVVEYLTHLPSVSFIWGNHDVAWYGACLGHHALIAHVLRISARYRRLTQLEEGYGITLQPLEHLIRHVYSDDPAASYRPKSDVGLRDSITIARLQKAAAVMQFKLEGQLIERNPAFEMDDRRLLHRMNLETGTIEIDGTTYRLRDNEFPTIDPIDPYKLSAEERYCLDRIRQSFMASQTLWDHMKFLVSHGSMYVTRDNNLIFHGCLPVDEDGEFQSFVVDGESRRGRALFDALDTVIARSLHQRETADLDLLWYLWSGPRSPLFGKNKIATFENDLVDDHDIRVETKNPYFQLIHEEWFCNKVLEEFGLDPNDGLIVNGHVPVKIEQGEAPIKRSGKAITIDGAFSEAYGDYGYTLVLEPNRSMLARHHHFESVGAAVRDGVDIIPMVTEIRRRDSARTNEDTERGEDLRNRIRLLERLCEAYRNNLISEEPGE